METLFLVQLSPVPTHTILWFEGSIVTAPIDCAGSLSNTGLKVVAPLIDFHTPPVAEPMFLAVNPEMVPESYFAGAGAWAVATSQRANSRTKTEIVRTRGKGRRAIVIM